MKQTIIELKRLTEQPKGLEKIDQLPRAEQPDLLLAWSIKSLQDKRFAEASFGARLLHLQKYISAEEVIPFLLVHPQLKDLPVLIKYLPKKENVEILLAFSELSEKIDTKLAQALLFYILMDTEAPPEQLEYLSKHIDELAKVQIEISPPLDVFVLHLIEQLYKVEREDAAAQPILGALREKATSTIQAIGGISSLTPQLLESWSAEQINPRPNEYPGLFRYAHDHLISFSLGEQLLIGMFLKKLATISQQAHLKNLWYPAFSYAVVHAIHRLGNTNLFPLRIRLLEQLLSEPNRFLERGELLYKLGTSRLTVYLEDLNQVTLANHELREALELSSRSEDIIGFVYAACGMARSLRQLLVLTKEPKYQVEIEQIRSRLQQLHPSELPNEVAAQLYTTLAALKDPVPQQNAKASEPESIESLRHALALSQPSDVAHINATLKLAEHLVEAPGQKEKEEAEQLLLKIFDLLPKEGAELLRLHSHFVYGKVLANKGDDKNACLQLEEALKLSLKEVGVTNDQISIRLLLGKIRCEQKKIDDGRFQLNQALQESRQINDKEGEAYASILLAGLDAEIGELARACSRLRALERNFHCGSWGTAALAIRLQLDAPNIDERVDFVRRCVQRELPLHPFAWPIIQKFSFELMEHFSPAEREQIKRFCQPSKADPCFEAKVLSASGKIDAACRLLSSYLREQPAPLETLRAASLLMSLLPDEQNQERLRLCGVVEELLEKFDEPEVRCDLVTALRICAEEKKDPNLIKRAWQHVQCAAKKIKDTDTKRHCAILHAQTIKSYLRLTFGISNEEQAEMACWYMGTQILETPNEYREYLLASVFLLLAPGPLTHPKVMLVSRELILRLKELFPNEDRTLHLLQRWSWIASLTGQALPKGWLEVNTQPRSKGPFDNFSKASLKLILNTETLIAKKITDSILDELIIASQVRPDLSAHIARQLVSSLCGESIIESRTGISALLLHAPSWPQTTRTNLLVLLDNSLRESWNFQVACLQIEILRYEDDNWLEGSCYDERTQNLLQQATGTLQQIDAHFFRGRACMDLWQSSRNAILSEGNTQLIQDARYHLSHAVDLVEQKKEYPDYIGSLLISTGNAFRQEPHSDLNKALQYYASAEGRITTDEEKAKLYKVRAEAYFSRKGSSDHERAEQEINLSLKLRPRGWLRAETLVLAAKIALEAPSQSRLDQIRKAATLLEDALEHCIEENKKPLLDKLLDLLSEWKSHSPKNKILEEKFMRLLGLYPEHQAPIQKAQLGAKHVRDDIEDAVQFISQPEIRAYTEGTRCIRVPNTQIQGIELPQEAKDRLKELYLGDQPIFLREQARALAKSETLNQKAGKLTAKAELLSHLVATGHATQQEVYDAAFEAENAIDAMPPEKRHSKAFLLLQLSQVWAPSDAYTHPIKDFPRAAALCQRAYDMANGRAILRRDALLHLARATRYRTDGDVQAHLHKARKILEEHVALCHEVGDAHGLQQGQQNLSEVNAHLADGAAISRYERSVQFSQNVYELGGTPAQAEAHAWNLTQLASQLPKEDALKLLYQAKDLFEKLDPSEFYPQRWASVENNRAVCLSAIARHEERYDDESRIWRRRIREVDIKNQPVLWAMTAHNLAHCILSQARSEEELKSGLELCWQVLVIRTVDESPRYHWETTLLAGYLLLGLLKATAQKQNDWFLEHPSFPFYLAEAEKLLTSGLEAARKLGCGSELFRVGQALAELSLIPRDAESVERLANLAWSASNDALAYMLADDQGGAEESAFCSAVAGQLAAVLAGSNVANSQGPIAFTLTDETCSRVLPWIIRSSSSHQRRLSARMYRPPEVSHQEWLLWTDAVSSNDPDKLARSLTSVRASARGFLKIVEDLNQTWHWLSLHPCSAAICLLETPQGLLAVVLDRPEQKRTRIFALNSTPPPIGEETLASELRSAFQSQKFNDEHPYYHVVKWGMDNIIIPLQNQLDEDCTRLLWLPFGVLRLVSPYDLWPRKSVAMSANLVLSHPAIHHFSSLMISVADPGNLPGSVDYGIELAETANSEKLTCLFSRGPKYGQRLDISCVGLQEHPSSPMLVLQHLAEHDLALFLCHGEVDDKDNAWLSLLDEQGEVALLGISEIAKEPKRLVGKTIILLSCETGRSGAASHRAGGLLGALLASGAREVIAPLCPVFLKQAVEVGKALLSQANKSRSFADILSQLVGESTPDETSPTLGRRVSEAERKAHRELVSLSRRAFVSWVS